MTATETLPPQSAADAGRAVEVDLLIIGAGPTGLFAAYYAGFRGLRVAVVDSLPELGGQITAMYPEKQILDVAGFPSDQGPRPGRGAGRAGRHRRPGVPPRPHRAEQLTTRPDDGRVGDRRRSTTAPQVTRRRRPHHRRASASSARGRCPPATAGWAAGWSSSCPSFAPYAGKDVVIVGGGDSAFDWALHLEPIATSVTLVHRRDAFRAHQRTVDAGDGASTSRSSPRPQVDRAATATGPAARRSRSPSRTASRHAGPAQAVVAALGFIADLGPLQQWGIEIVEAARSSSTPRCAPTCRGSSPPATSPSTPARCG